jgi:hypothetical protein
MRAPILQYGVTEWRKYHSFAAGVFETDLDVMWYRQSAATAGYDWVYTPFDPLKLFQGFNYLSTGIVLIVTGDIICVLSTHIAGGTVGNYYQAKSNLGSINLATTIYTTTSNWLDVTDSKTKFRYCVSCYVLFLAYQRLSTREKDDIYAEQREYWRNKYADQFDKILQVGISYDFNDDGVLDEVETVTDYKRFRLRRV